jgi:sulfide dehydrogenase cytochrome subunit
MKWLAALAFGAVVTATSLSAAAQTIDPNHVRLLASACANCHGTDGRTQATIPGLAGRSQADIAGQMKAFKAGTRPATIMHQIAKGYTDEHIDAIALYFSRVKP